MTKNRRILVFLSMIFVPMMFFSGCKDRQSATHVAPIANKVYRCPMHPAYTSDKPGDCPICGMKLVLVEGDKPGQSEATQSINFKGKERSVPGYSEVNISPAREQLIGVKTGIVEYRALKKIIRASARVAYDAELYNSISEYKAAIAAKQNIKESPWPDVHERAEALVHASALRLKQIGLSDQQIENINNDYKNPTNLLLGETGGSIWIYAQVYEYEAGSVHPGQKMEVTAPALPGKK